MSDETILIVDDGQDNREFIIDYVLKPHGFNYLSARNGEEGLRLAIEYHPDLILLDLQMPKLSGIQVLEQLHARHLEIPTILMTFHGSEDIAIEVYRMGVKDYIKKPYYPEEMLESIENALTETRLRREKDALTDRVLRANQELQRRLTEFEILYHIGKVVTSTIDLDKLLPQIVNAAVQITHAEEGYIILNENDKMVRRAHKLPHVDRAKSLSEVIRDRVAEYVITKQESVTLGPKRLRQAGQNAPLSVASVPLKIGKRVLGALQVINHSDNYEMFDKNDTMMLEALSDYAAIAIENSHNYARVQASADKVQDTFERFVAPSVVHKALSDDVKLGGERQEISVVFADIRGYTTFSESVSPEKVIEVLNHYLSIASGIVIGWEGTLDKFFGDGLMAIFNAPEKQVDHVYRATEAALSIMKAAEEIKQAYGYDLTYSVGVHVGEAVVGYIGSNYAVNYTAIGDTVNLAKRLQEYAEPGQIIIEEAVVARLGAKVDTRALGSIKIKGRKRPAQAFELIDIK